jgi:hypothetical protein
MMALAIIGCGAVSERCHAIVEESNAKGGLRLRLEALGNRALISII